MDRKVRHLNQRQKAIQSDELRPFSFYEDAANIVLLGDPGAGKSHTFREHAEQGGKFVTARHFLITPAVKFDGTLYIDGLDEKRAGRGDRDTVDALVERLFAVAPRKVRISCRVADWLGDTDLAVLRAYFEQSGEPVVLQLGKLSAEEQREVLLAEGLDAAAAERFLSEARTRALDDFLQNPQNLIMLLQAVRSGTWPDSRKDLFELSTGLMLAEFDKDRARSGAGVFSADELRPAAGALCAARLISDIEAISLTDHETSAFTPSYRSLTLIEPGKAAAALTRRVFVAASAPETVDYAHRTTAEYLGAHWLSSEIRNGLPLGRVRALMGIDGHPAPELRGLHAWLAVHLHERATELIDADPYGVLTYGDAASLSRGACSHLIRALDDLSQTDPWFRSGSWESPSIGALARHDMVPEFQAIMRSNTAGVSVRSIVVEAAALGPPLPALKNDLAKVILRQKSTYSERVFALIALLRLGDAGKASARAVFVKLKADISGVRLRAEIIRRLYADPYGPTEVAALLNAIAATSDTESVTGILYALAEEIPAADIPVLLDSIPPLSLHARAKAKK
jgi:predicted NACHT family NTPase